MTVRRIGLAVGVAVLLASGGYVFVYLYRWEWNRALMAASLFVMAEVAVLGAVVLDRLRTLSSRVDELSRRDYERRLTRVRDAAPEPGEPFAWLSPQQDKLGVFVPFLLGAGVVVSGLAWVVERIARGTAQPALERSLASRLGVLQMPDALVDPADGLGGWVAAPMR